MNPLPDRIGEIKKAPVEKGFDAQAVNQKRRGFAMRDRNAVRCVAEDEFVPAPREQRFAAMVV